MSLGVLVEIEPYEYEHAYSVGIRRFTANWGRADAPHYNRELMEEDRNAQAAAAICELAVAKYLNEYWHGSIWHVSEQNKYRHMADVGKDIEVRRVRTQKGVTVRPGDKGKKVWGARVTDKEYRQVELLGFIPADDVLSVRPAGYVVPFARLEKPWIKEARHAG